MNRDALLVYLRDLRDLELAKLSLPATHAQGAAALLQDAYALNLIPSSYHNLAFIYYLYHTMSTSLATMEDALRPKCLAADTQQVLEKLCLDTNQHPPTLLRTRQQEARLPEAVQPALQFLTDLAQTAQPQKERAQYAQIHALHQRANDFFAKLA